MIKSNNYSAEKKIGRSRKIGTVVFLIHTMNVSVHYV